MVHEDRIEHTELLERSIDHLSDSGFTDIKADLDGYESPKSFYKKDTDVTIIPDIVGYMGGVKYYFELGVKSSKPRLLKSKWLFLDTLSKLKKHKFKIITMRGHYRFTDQIIKELDIQIKPIRLSATKV